KTAGAVDVRMERQPDAVPMRPIHRLERGESILDVALPRGIGDLLEERLARGVERGAGIEARLELVDHHFLVDQMTGRERVGEEMIAERIDRERPLEEQRDVSARLEKLILRRFDRAPMIELPTRLVVAVPRARSRA